MDSLKMAALEEVHGGTSFDEEKDLSRLVDAEEIRDGLLNAIVEYLKIFASEASDELSARIGDEDADADAVHADVNVGRRLGRLLRKDGEHKQESASDEKGGAMSTANKHDANPHGNPAAKETEAPSHARFPERGTGHAISNGNWPKL